MTSGPAKFVLPLEQRGMGARVRWAVLAVLVSSTVFLAGSYALNWLLHSVDKEPARAHLRHAFETGELGPHRSLEANAVIGVHQTNDCLIFDMASRDGGDRLMYVFGAPLGQTKPRSGRCEALRTHLFSDSLVSIKEVWYLRYLHGYRAVAVGLLRMFEVDTARLVMKAFSYGVFALLCAVNLALLLRRHRLGLSHRGGNEIAYIGLGLCFMTFFGLPYFGQSISHAPAIVTLGLFLLAWSISDYRGALHLRRMAVLVIGFALFTAYFEYLTGYIPVAVTVLTLLVAIGPQVPNGFRDLAGRLVFLQALFAGCVVSALSLNLLFTAAFSGREDVLGGFFRALLFRMSDERSGAADMAQAAAAAEPQLGFGEVLSKVADQLPHLGVPDRWTGMALLLVALGILLVGMVEILLSRRSREIKWRTALIACSVIPLLVWMLAFANHTYVHASFMVRILVGVFAAAVVMLAWLHRIGALVPARGATAAPLATLS